MLKRGIADIIIASNQHTAISIRVKSISKRRTLNGNIITNNLSRVITIIICFEYIINKSNNKGI